MVNTEHQFPNTSNKIRRYVPTTCIKIILELPAIAIRQAKEIKDSQGGKKEIELYLLTDGPR